MFSEGYEDDKNIEPLLLGQDDSVAQDDTIEDESDANRKQSFSLIQRSLELTLASVDEDIKSQQQDEQNNDNYAPKLS